MTPYRNSKKRKSHHSNPYSSPTALQIRDAYSQLPTQFGKQPPSPSSLKSTFLSSSSGSVSGSNMLPLPSPEEIDARRRAMLKPYTPKGVGVGAGKGAGGARYMDVGGFMVPSSPPEVIAGRPAEENGQLAEGLRGMLEDETATQSTERLPMIHRQEREVLAQAFRQEYYTPHHPDPTKSRVSVPLTPSSDSELEPNFDSRSKNRKAAIAGQEVGVGVIGFHHRLTHSTTADGREYLAKVIEGDHGCDTPSYQFKDSLRGNAISLETLKEHLELPPLALDHPARMWNSLIHALKPELQPIVRWTFESSHQGKLGYLAEMILILPPSHPAITQHPLFMTVPKDTRSKQYITVVDLLGGVKRWKGEVRKRKADAQNTALIRCIADNAISWIYAPATTNVEVGEDGQHREIGQLTETESMMEQDNEEIVIDEEMEQLDSTAPDPERSPAEKLALEVDDTGYTSPLPSPNENSHEADKEEYTDSEIPLIELNDLDARSLSCMCSDDDQFLPAPASESTRYSDPLQSLEEVEYSTDDSSLIECSVTRDAEIGTRNPDRRIRDILSAHIVGMPEYDECKTGVVNKDNRARELLIAKFVDLCDLQNQKAVFGTTYINDHIHGQVRIGDVEMTDPKPMRRKREEGNEDLWRYYTSIAKMILGLVGEPQVVADACGGVE